MDEQRAARIEDHEARVAEIAGEVVDREAGREPDRRQVGGWGGLGKEADAARERERQAARPAGTPEPVVNRLNAEFTKALREPDMAKRLSDLGAAWRPNSPADYKNFLRADLEKWRQVVSKSGAKFD